MRPLSRGPIAHSADEQEQARRLPPLPIDSSPDPLPHRFPQIAPPPRPMHDPLPISARPFHLLLRQPLPPAPPTLLLPTSPLSQP